MKKSILELFINESILNLLESSRYEKQTKRVFSDVLREKLMSLASENHPAEYAFTMTNVEKVGINPETNFKTPAGVYFYPLTKEYCQRLFDDKLPFGGERKYVGLVKLNNLNVDGKWLKFIDHGTDFVSDEALKLIFDRFPTETQKMMKSGKHKSFNNDSKVFDIGHFYANKSDDTKKTIKWSSFLRRLGFVGVYDSGNGIIHSHEKCQLVCLSPEAYNVVDIFETKDIRSMRLAIEKSSSQNQYIENIIKEIPNMTFLHKIFYAKQTKIPEVLAELSKDPSVLIKQAVAVNIYTDFDTLLFLCKSKNEKVKLCILSRTQLDKRILDVLHTDKLRSVRIEVAEKINTPQHCLVNLSKDQDEMVRTKVAGNISTPIEILRILASDVYVFARCAVAKNLNTPIDVLEFLKNDDDNRVIRQVYFALNDKLKQ